MDHERDVLGELQESGLAGPVGSGHALSDCIGADAAGKLELSSLISQITAAHQQASGSFQSGLVHAINAGVLLNEAKARVGHGEWMSFVEQCGVPGRTARLYMRVAQQRQTIKLAGLANLPTLGLEAADKYIRQENKKEVRDTRLSDLAEKTEQATDELGVQQYNVILADPPWKFEPYSRETGMDRAADNHYQTLDTEGIAALDVDSAKMPDCVLFLWATAPMLEDAMAVMCAWGFQYKSQLVWVKDRVGTGYWFRSRHELLLVGTCGNIPAPEMGTQEDSVLEWPVAKHSEKPEAVHKMISKMYPFVPKLEMFARRQAEGWDCWGNEA